MPPGGKPAGQRSATVIASYVRWRATCNPRVVGSIPTGPTVSTCGFALARAADWGWRPQDAHKALGSFLRGGVHPGRQIGEVVVEEAGVDVERHRRRGVPEHPLDALDGRPAGHRE